MLDFFSSRKDIDRMLLPSVRNGSPKVGLLSRACAKRRLITGAAVPACKRSRNTFEE